MESLLNRICQARDLTVTFKESEETVLVSSHDFLIHSESDLFHIQSDPTLKQIELDPKHVSPSSLTFMRDFIEGIHLSKKANFETCPDKECTDVSIWWVDLYNAADYLSFDPNF